MSKAAEARKKNKKIEAEFSTSLHRGAQQEGFCRVPIPDSVPMMMPNGARLGQTPKFCDMLLAKDGFFYALELKRTLTNTLEKSKFKEHQIPCLTRWGEVGGFPWVVCLFVGDKIKRALAVPVWNVVTAFDSGFDGLSLAWFERWGVELQRLKALPLDSKTFGQKPDSKPKLSWGFEVAHRAAVEYRRRQA